VQAWFIGSESGEAIASVLAGDVNPSGKLPFTWYASLDQCGAHATGSYPGTWREDYKIIDEEYKEGIYVGYRYTDSKGLKPLFAFGHGLSYTTFKLGKVTTNTQHLTPNTQMTFTVPVTNTGKVAGSEIVQLYVAAKQSKVDRPCEGAQGLPEGLSAARRDTER
jgi:beta-glucosidase